MIHAQCNDTGSREFREMSLRMPEPDAAILGRRERIVAALRTIVPGEGVIAAEREIASLRKRRPYRLPAAAHGGRIAGDHGTGRRNPALLPWRGDQGRPPRGRDVAVGWRVAARRWRAARYGEVQSDPRNRFRKSRCRRRTGCNQPGGQQCGCARGILLRTGSVLADCLHDRRQCGGKFRRRALPEIRHDHQ